MNNKRTRKHTRAFVIFKKHTEGDSIVIGGIDDENDTKKKKRLRLNLKVILIVLMRKN